MPCPVYLVLAQRIGIHQSGTDAAYDAISCSWYHHMMFQTGSNLICKSQCTSTYGDGAPFCMTYRMSEPPCPALT
eukprot:701301-Rhodomonas_salina.6